MPKTRVLTYCLLLVVNSFFTASAQTMYVPPAGQVFVNALDSISIFGNVINDGRFGTGAYAVVDFMGKSWSNSSEAQMTDESNNGGGISGPGGTVRFMLSPERGSYHGPQYVQGGYNNNIKAGASFPNISLENGYGLYLQDLSDLKVRNELHFEQGHVYLNGWNLSVGTDSAGIISNYSKERFIVTGQNVAGGFLYRAVNAANAGQLVFPIGTDDQSYSPLALEYNNNISASVGARVFDSVYANAVAGPVNAADYVSKTWEIKNAGQQEVNVTIQHHQNDEGMAFSKYRDSSYVSLYDQQLGIWDFDASGHYSKPGTLTTGSRINNTYMNSRSFSGQLGDDVYLSVSTLRFSKSMCPDANFQQFFAQRYNIRDVQLIWNTMGELNVMKYVVERRRQNETSWQAIDTVDSHALSGFSDNINSYFYNDVNLYDDWTYYRLKLIGNNGCQVYTDIVKVPWVVEITVTPNPSPGLSQVHVFGVKHTLMMYVIDQWGRTQRTFKIPADRVITLSDLPSALYYLVFRDPSADNNIIKTIKLVVIKTK